jgi:phosphopantothenoylcysteine decarboxylase / phosphopantothenate---cysteine ligase
MLKGKRIIYGVTGSVAAVKAPIVARELVRRGATVYPALTASGAKFTTAYGLSVLTRNETASDVFGSPSTWHIHLGRSVDGMLIAPCSATTIGKLRYGIYDTVVTLLAASFPKGTPLVIAPAMDEEMWLQPAVQENIAWLRDQGVGIIEPISGALASGLEGMGRMPEPEELVEEFANFLSMPRESGTSRPKFKLAFDGKRVLISGGPTYEPIDPVRFIGNRSSGKMGAALANEAASVFGANVTLVMGPSAAKTRPLVHRIDVETTDQMYAAMLENLPGSDIIIMSAAVSDYRAKNVARAKLKKKGNDIPNVELERTTDILMKIASEKRKDQVVIGFALESQEEGDKYARKKLEEKGLDVIVLNSYDQDGAGFGSETNKVTIYTKRGLRRELGMMSKTECAREILASINELV